MFKKVFVFGILIALVLASFPTLGVLAKDQGQREKLEAKWDAYVTQFNKIAKLHGKVDFRSEDWLKNHKDATARNKIQLDNALMVTIKILMLRRQSFKSTMVLMQKAR